MGDGERGERETGREREFWLGVDARDGDGWNGLTGVRTAGDCRWVWFV